MIFKESSQKPIYDIHPVLPEEPRPKFKLNLNKALVFLGAVVLGLIVIFIFWWNKEIMISNRISIVDRNKPARSQITGLECPQAGYRPIAVMMPSDPEARPLSGISQADMVFEMPVTPNGVTRFMAIFQCEKPKEIGSVRSARNDFIPLASGLKVIYAHWGGEHAALKKLDDHIIDNIDALKYEGTAFYRKPRIRPPHNGFTNLDLLAKTAQDLKYDMRNSFSGYPHQEDIPKKNISNLADQVDVNYPRTYFVSWTYDQETNLYGRSRGGSPENDGDNLQQVRAGVIIIMNTTSSFLREQYINVDVQGEGDIQIYQNGMVINGKWKKDPSSLDSKLYFYDESGKEIKFAPGKIWVEIYTP